MPRQDAAIPSFQWNRQRSTTQEARPKTRTSLAKAALLVSTRKYHERRILWISPRKAAIWPSTTQRSGGPMASQAMARARPSHQRKLPMMPQAMKPPSRSPSEPAKVTGASAGE